MNVILNVGNFIRPSFVLNVWSYEGQRKSSAYYRRDKWFRKSVRKSSSRCQNFSSEFLSKSSHARFSYIFNLDHYHQDIHFKHSADMYDPGFFAPKWEQNFSFSGLIYTVWIANRANTLASTVKPCNKVTRLIDKGDVSIGSIGLYLNCAFFFVCHKWCLVSVVRGRVLELVIKCFKAWQLKVCGYLLMIKSCSDPALIIDAVNTCRE